MNAKKVVQALLARVPDDCTLEDIQYHLYVLQKLERGQREEASGQVHSQQEVETVLEALLEEGLASGEAAEMTPEEWQAIRAEVRERLRGN